MRTSRAVLGLLVCCALVACGGDPKEESSSSSAGKGGVGGLATSGAGGTAGTFASGGSGGAPVGGSSGSSSGGYAGSEPSAGAHCSPGTPFSAGIGYAGGYLSNCSSYPFDDNIMSGEGVTIRSLNLQEPLVPGQAYAISMDFVFDIGVLEFWGANEECGPGIEQLYAAPGSNLAGTTFCLELDASQQFSHLIMVWRMGAEHEEVAFCPGGTCG